VELLDRADGQLKKKYERDAEIAYWFGINPFGLSGEQRIGLLANLERMKAQQTIHLGNFDPTNWQGIYELYLRAYGNQLAEDARMKAMELYIDRQIKGR
jgi:hypothetical protein